MKPTALLASASSADNSTTPKPKSPRRYAKLDGKTPARPRGRHAGDAPAPREVVTIPTQMRLGFRPAEYAALLGVSTTHIWRGIRNGAIEVVDVNGVTIVPRSFAIKQGIIADDTS